jgi:hypothetical protein
VPLSVFHFQHGGVPVQIYDSPLARRFQAPTRDKGIGFLALYERLLERFQPDLVLTYGGDWVAQEIMALAKRKSVHQVRHTVRLDSVRSPNAGAGNIHEHGCP